jgi:DNA-binding NarL/FixJ family response regulator
VLRIVIAAPDEALNVALAEVISPAEGLEVVGTAPDGERAMEVVRQTRPDVVVVDLEIAMPPRGGLSLVAAITDELPGTVVLVLAAEPLASTAPAALAAGATAVLAKDGSAQFPADLWPDATETDVTASTTADRSLPAERDPAQLARALAFTPSDLVRVLRWA